MKTKFELEISIQRKIIQSNATISIIGKLPEYDPYIVIQTKDAEAYYYLKDKDLEKFAVNILKALKSKKLKP